MAWVIASNKSKKKVPLTKSLDPQFKNLHWRLLGSYLLVMTAILLLSDILIYKFFARSLYRQLDERIFNLANAATHSLAILKKNPQNLN